jgi:phosphate transport system substrate-binding protein
MNDDFLHRIRVEPPAGFMTSLKARLDRQLPPAPAAPRRSLLRMLIFGLLFGGSVFAISLLTVNGLPDLARNLARDLVQIPHQGSKARADATGGSDARARFPGGSRATPIAARQGPAEEPGRAGQTSNLPRNTGAPGPANSTAPTGQSIAGGASTAPTQVVNLVTPKALQAYIKLRTADFSRRDRPNRPDVSVTAADSATETLAQFCSKSAKGAGAWNKPVLEVAAVPRRITWAEFDLCTRNIGDIAEVQIERQAIVLLRSKLYGALALSASDIFLALAAEIPDPERPGAFISNPNTTWDRVNDSLGSEPIEVYGPPASSRTGVAFREILLESGCNSLPAIAALKQTDSVRYEQICKTLRKDGPYLEMPEEVTFDALQRLQSHPNAIGVLGYRLFRVFVGPVFQSNYMLITNPIGGVEPTLETISNGTYPGSRTLYLYLNQWRAPADAPYLLAWLAQTSTSADNFIAAPLDEAQMKVLRNYPLTLPDLKL